MSKRHVSALMACLALLALVAAPAAAQVRLKGEITGFVLDESGETLPGASVVLTGERLLQSSLSAVTNEKGFFRLLNLNPGAYVLEISLAGFNTLKLGSVRVSVGQSEPIRAVLTATKLQSEVVVTGQAPLIETKSVQLSTNYSTELVQKLPTGRDMLDLLDTTPGINDKGAYGAGGYYDYIYSRGSTSSAVRLNGVDVSNVEVGNTWVNPNYDTIDEVQVVGVGASAEFGNYTGATINVVTKGGTNAWHGSANAYYDDKSLWADNSKGVEDLKPQIVKFNPEFTATLGGPLVKEKLFFFLAAGYNTNKIKEYGAPAYAYLKQPHFYLKLDWLASKNDTVSLMANSDPLNHSNKGLTPGSGPETAFTSKLSILTLFADWQHTFGTQTLFEAKYAGYMQRYQAIPNAPNAPSFDDSTIGRRFGSYGIIRDWPSARHEINASVTHYADDFLDMSHEFKFGLEYGTAFNKTIQDTTSGVLMWAYDYGPYVAVTGITGYSYNSKATVTQLGGFVQDNIQVSKKLTLNLGLRVDLPRLTARGFQGTVTRYKNISPRLGLSYDFGGDAKNVLHLHYGRYYDKMTSYGLGLGFPKSDSKTIDYYMIYITPEQLAVYRNDLAALTAAVVQPGNLFLSFPFADLIPVEKNLHSGYTDVFNIGFEKELFKDFALSVDYIHKRDAGMLQINSRTQHTYRQFDWTDPYIGDTVTLWDQVDMTPDEYYFTNSKWGKRRHHFLMVELKKRQTGNWSMAASYVFQSSKGNVDNDGSGALGLGRWGQDTDPYYTDNPLQWGPLAYERPHQFKLLGTVLLPWDVMVAADFRLLSGNPWQPMLPLWMTGAYRPQWTYIMLEPRGNRRHPMSKYLNARLSKSFRIKDAQLEFMLDVLNVFNSDSAQSYYTEPYAVYPLAGGDAFGRPQDLQPPRRARLGIRLTF